MPECHLKNESCGFRCTGYDGSHVWRKIHQAAESIECEECRIHGTDLMKFAHDIVNAGLGKPVYDKDNFHKMLHEANCAANSCKLNGKC